VRGKGQHILLEAAARLQRSGYDLKVLLVGDGPSRTELQQMSRNLQMEASVIFTGHQPDTRPFLAGMDIFVLPSLNEGLPLSLLEAMAMGLPVIATRSGGISELLDDGRTGLLAPVDDVNALALRIEELLENVTLQQRLAREAQAHVRAQFDHHKMLALHDDVFNELMFAV
jgi:glycosyltransferase involved in cell wall biosynthesis